MLTLSDLRIKEQDENLESLGNAVARLGDLSLTISKEIDTQNRLLTSLESEVDSAHEKADFLTQKTRELVKKAGGKRNFCTIIILSLILIALVLLVIYT